MNWYILILTYIINIYITNWLRYYKLKKKISEKNIRGLVLTLRPDNAQKLLLDKHLNDTRFIYN